MSTFYPVTAQPAQLFARPTTAVSMARSTPDVAAADRREVRRREADRREAQRREAARAARQRAHAERVRDNAAARHPLALR